AGEKVLFDAAFFVQILRRPSRLPEPWKASEIRFPLQPSISPTAEGFAPQMANARQAAIQAIACAQHCLNRIDFRKTPVKDLFGVNVFSIEEQRQRLPKPVFQALRRTIDRGVPLEADHADAIAVAMKDWAM